MPDSPPCNKNSHPAQPFKKVENQNQSERGILDSDFDTYSSRIRFVESEEPSCPVSKIEGQGVVDKDEESNQSDDLEKDTPVCRQSAADDGDEKNKSEDF